MVHGTIQTVVQRGPLSTPSRAIKLWLPGEFARPLHNEYVSPFDSEQSPHANFDLPGADQNRPANITIPYAGTLSARALERCRFGGRVEPEMDGSVHVGGGKRSFSTVAGSRFNTAQRDIRLPT
ncbi:hypothetical protein B0T25DRAFT_563500 [Lasiosphaeria hispida]|uniref:Uncharacterized protein n=1 Tax=Lasiosphaeria hispida TaxID=260671 RepID=A0AAJ0HX22_9PEZI|nr:hypothetical protein B0T25DRAFT_563500 [Lasiosphaeria hispida]